MIKLSNTQKYDLNFAGIYQLTNTVDGKIYVGQAQNISKRMVEHKKRKKNYPLYNAIRKYTPKNFRVEILEKISDVEKLTVREQYWLDLLEPFVDSDNGYNILKMADSFRGYKHTDVALQKMSKVHKGKVLSETTRLKMSEAKSGENHPMYGKKLSKITRQKISKATSGENNHMYGEKHSVGSRKKMSRAKSGENNPMYGKKVSDATRQKRSDSMKKSWAKRKAQQALKVN